jgi:hypothetical protein
MQRNSFIRYPVHAVDSILSVFSILSKSALSSSLIRPIKIMPLAVLKYIIYTNFILLLSLYLLVRDQFSET